MKRTIQILFLILSLSVFSATKAQLGSAPLRMGKALPAQLDLSDTSMVWLAVDFDNVSHPSFELGDFVVNFENSNNTAQNDFFHFERYKRGDGAKTFYIVGLALPVGQYKITSIKGVSFKLLIIGKMWFRVEIPLNVPDAGKHYYLGNISIQNVETGNKKLQRAGEPFPLIDQIASGFGAGTLRFKLTDAMESDVTTIKNLFPGISSLQSARFEKTLIPEIKVPYALGQGLDPIVVRALAPKQTSVAAVISNDSQPPEQLAQPVMVAHSQAVPPTSSFASNLDIQSVPQKMSDSMKRIYTLYLDSKRTKALAISGYGALGLGYGTDAMKAAIDNCEKYGKPCALYAVDSSVVWNSATPLAQMAKLEQDKIASLAANLRPSGFANIDDVEAVPKLGAKGKELYAEWLTKPSPKAVVISDKGALARGYGTNAIANAIKTCENFGRPCKVYGLNSDVVFEPFLNVHDTPIPPDSNYAQIANVDSPPYAFPSHKTQYVTWLEKPSPKAIAVNDAGSLYAAHGGDSMVQAMEYCRKSNRLCKLYAVDSTVVFTPFSVTHSAPLPETTSFAQLTNREALPKATALSKSNYDVWLKRPHPKAFSISESGASSYRLGPDSVATSLKACENFGKQCKTYAVDDQIVFKPFVSP